MLGCGLGFGLLAALDEQLPRRIPSRSHPVRGGRDRPGSPGCGAGHSGRRAGYPGRCAGHECRGTGDAFEQFEQLGAKLNQLFADL
jgi:hypothetical protein